ncbi:MAG: response regulator [Gammaproteobacteria bacterium]|jgi:CheY-like chemotaxis protein|nr:response regulator [Pseudomonadota bacterium]QOJ20619.1 MAG: response regulator [Gammaproteobacteria bacterium]
MNLIKEQDRKLKGFTVLVVEDNELNQQVAKGLLEYNGATVALANHGKEALDMLSRSSFDCVLMDIQMPVMDGLEAARLIRANPQWPDMLIIAVTANADQHHKDLCQNAGMNDFLAKPIDPERLVSTLLKWLTPESGAADSKPSTKK